MEQKNKLNATYEVIMASLALVVVAVLFIEFTRPLTDEQKSVLTAIDLSILVVFAVDYFYRLVKAPDKWKFFKGNIPDLIAIIPFDKAFRIARLARLFRLARLLRTTRMARATRLFRLLRLFAFASRFWGTFRGVLKTNGLGYIVLITVTIIIGGAVGIMFLETNMADFGDALWWSLVTTTTVGYGDISPESTGGRVLAGFLMIVGIGFLGMVTGSIATYFVDKLSNKQQGKESVVDEQIEYVKGKLDEIDSLSREDVAALNGLITYMWEVNQNKHSEKDERQLSEV